MMWNSIKFGELASEDKSAFSMGPFGSKLTKRDYVEEGVPLVRGVNLGNGRFFDDDFVFITTGKADEVLAANVEPGDLMFVHRGTIGQVSMIPRTPRFDRYVICSSLVKARLDEAIAVPEFYYYWFRSPKGRNSILSNASVVGVPGIATPLTTIRSLVVPFPGLGEQRAIAAVLEALDGKIAVNDRIAATARELGISQFQQAVLADGSEEMSLGLIATMISRGVAPKYTDDVSGMTVINQKCIRGGMVNLEPSRRTIADKVKEAKTLRPNDVLINSTGVGTLGRVARWTTDETATVDSHVTIVRFAEDKVDPVCAGFALLLAEPQIEFLGEGSTGQTELKRAQLEVFEVTMPTRGSQRELRKRLEALEGRIDQARAESRVLAQLRDTLLPRLMSGEIRVKDAERIVEDVT